MNIITRIGTMIALTALSAAPTAAAQARPAAERAAASADGAHALPGLSSSWIIAIIALSAVLGGILVASSGDDAPISP